MQIMHRLSDLQSGHGGTLDCPQLQVLQIPDRDILGIVDCRQFRIPQSELTIQVKHCISVYEIHTCAEWCLWSDIHESRMDCTLNADGSGSSHHAFR
jgi:hypothetical protein